MIYYDINLHVTLISPEFSSRFVTLFSGCSFSQPPPTTDGPSSLEAVTVCVDKSHKDCKVPVISPPINGFLLRSNVKGGWQVVYNHPIWQEIIPRKYTRYSIYCLRLGVI